jgi:hypothetical protein
MTKQLVVLGDSFCHGIGTVTPFKNIDNTNHAFGKYLADHFNLKYINLAEPGISILRTIEIGYDYLFKNCDQVEKIIIGWTNPSRLGIYSDSAALQILPSYILLGDTADEDVFVDYEVDVKFITNKKNEKNLKVLPKLHRLIIENDFLDQKKNSLIYIKLFKSWLDSMSLVYHDFSVFGQIPEVELPISFHDVMQPVIHPTKHEQKLFADLLLKQLQQTQ